MGSAYEYGIKHEHKALEKLEGAKLFSGLRGVSGSGNQFHSKEDLQNDQVLIQVKSTKSPSYRIQEMDLRKLFNHAAMVDKLGVLVVYFTKYHHKLFVLIDARLSPTLHGGGYLNSGDPCSSTIVKSSLVKWDTLPANIQIGSYVLRGYTIDDFEN